MQCKLIFPIKELYVHNLKINMQVDIFD